MSDSLQNNQILPNKTKVTLKDIASLAGCSVGTASAVINKAKSNTRISNETRRQILRIAQQSGYRPHFAAQALVRQSSRTLGVYIGKRAFGGIGNGAYDSRLLHGVEKACLEENFGLLLINMAASQPLEQCLTYVQQFRVDGLVVIQTQEDDNEEVANLLYEQTDRVVLVDHPAAGHHGVSVVFDNYAAMDIAVDHLVKLGHRRIGFLGGCTEKVISDGLARAKGFVKAMIKRDLEPNDRWIHDRDHVGVKVNTLENFCQREGAIGVEALMALPVRQRPTALVAYNDLVAAGACRRLGELGLSVPRDISITGLDDSDFCALLTPSLTSVRQPLEDMGYQAGRSLINQINGEHEESEGSDENRTLRFGPSLIVRESTGLAAKESL